MKWILPSTYQNPVYPYERSTDQDAEKAVKHQVVIVGAGPVGLSAALDLASRGIPSVVLSKENTVSIGSRAICFAKKTLEVIHRLDRDAATRMLKKGVIWQKGKVFYKKDQVYEFDLLPESGHKVPAFINLQQYYFEEYLVDAAQAHPLISLRWQNELINSRQYADHVWLNVQTPEGAYELEADYLLACDGVHSQTRKRMGIPFKGEAFEENFLIADITMENDFPTERWFWFDPPFNPGYSALLHKQPDGVWRIDLQLGWDIDKDQELEPERIKSRLRQMLGPEVKFELEWTSIYQFRCMRIQELIHDRVIFMGDSAHLVSPFGARGANGGIQDADNLIWKLVYILQGKAPHALLATYQEERSLATDENIAHSTSATDFISPKSETSTLFRNATLDLAKQHRFAQALVNSGRLSHPYRYIQSSLTTADQDSWEGNLQPGYAISDVPLKRNGVLTQLLDELGPDFTLLIYHQDAEKLSELLAIPTSVNNIPLHIIPVCDHEASDVFADEAGFFAKRYGAINGSWYLIRPDHYIAARGKAYQQEAIHQAILQATCQEESSASIPSTADLFPKYAQDERYHLLIEAHKGLSKTESDSLNAKLILLLMEQVEGTEAWSEILAKTKS